MQPDGVGARAVHRPRGSGSRGIRPMPSRHVAGWHHHDLEEVRALLGHARIDTTQVYASIRPPQLKRAVAFYEQKAGELLAGW